MVGLVGPFFFEVVDFEAAVGWYPRGLNRTVNVKNAEETRNHSKTISKSVFT